MVYRPPVTVYRGVYSCSLVVSAAGNAFCQAALLHLQMQSKHDAATNFIDAGNAFKKADPQGLFCLCFYYLDAQNNHNSHLHSVYCTERGVLEQRINAFIKSSGIRTHAVEQNDIYLQHGRYTAQHRTQGMQHRTQGMESSE